MIREGKLSRVQYRLAYSQDLDFVFKQTLPIHWSVKKIDQTWGGSVKLGSGIDLSFRLPTSEEMDELSWKNLAYASDLKGLIQIRERVANRILDFEFDKNDALTAADRHLLNLAMPK